FSRDWSSDVCSSDLVDVVALGGVALGVVVDAAVHVQLLQQSRLLVGELLELVVDAEESPVNAPHRRPMIWAAANSGIGGAGGGRSEERRVGEGSGWG